MKVIFMGTPDFAEQSLKELHQSGYDVLAVVTNQDKPQGRGMKLMPSPVKKFAEENNLEVLQPTKVKNNPEFIEQIKDLKPDIICVVAYGKILPKELLEIPQYGCINVHASLLPKYRGAAPIQWAVLNGDKTTGVTTMYMDEGMDTGDMILKQEVEIGVNETTGELWDRLAQIGGKLLVQTLKQIEAGTAPRQKQEGEFSMAPMLSKNMAKIDWENQTAQEIKNLVRGLNPIMGAYTYLNGKKIKFWRVDVVSADVESIHAGKSDTVRVNDVNDVNADSKVENLKNGTVISSDPKEGIIIKTKQKFLKVIEIQGENAKRMSIQDFLRGNPIKVHSVFETEL